MSRLRLLAISLVAALLLAHPATAVVALPSVAVSTGDEAPLLDAVADTAEATLAPLVRLDEYIVGYRDAPPVTLLSALGARVVETDPTLRFVVVETARAELLEVLVGVHPDFTYVERNGATFGADSIAVSVSWDGAMWDGAMWDGATWDTTVSAGATWDGATWDGATWDGATWDASRWSPDSWDGSAWDGAPRMDAGFGNGWHLGAIHAPKAWERTMSYHARTICVIDSGLDAAHPDLERNVKRLADGSFGRDFVNDDHEPWDDGGHGTHVGGIAAATTGNERGVSGVSQAWLIGAKVLDSRGSGTEAHLASALAWCADQGAHVGLLALHTEQDNDAVRAGVEYAQAKGMLLAAASGNAGATCGACVAFPAAYKGMLAVGASHPSSEPAAFSNGGDRLSLLAPGVSIPGPVPGASYATGSGTSQATGVAAGAAALLWSARPDLKAQDIVKALVSTAKDDGPKGFDQRHGHGHLRLDHALRALDAK